MRREGPCPRCGGPSYLLRRSSRPLVCRFCTQERDDQRAAIAGPALRAVQAAKKRGELAYLPDGTPCVDCGAEAMVYDHREYAKPLDVEPVCVSCNKRRGPAIDSAALLPHPFEIELARSIANSREA